MTTEAAVILCLVDALKASARSHQPRWHWRFEPYIQSEYNRDTGSSSLVRIHQDDGLVHNYVVRLRRPRCINGMMESPRDYFATISDRYPIRCPIIVCKRHKHEARLLCIDDDHNISFWIGHGWRNTDRHTWQFGRPSPASIPFRASRHLQYVTYALKPVKKTNTKLEDIPVKLLIASEESFATVSKQVIEILHKSFEPAHGVGQAGSIKRLMRYGLAIRMDGPNTTYDLWR